MKSKSLILQNGSLIVAVLALVGLPLAVIKGDYRGADGQAKEVIHQLNPQYQPWFQPLWVPASSEIESLLFASQAALGAGVIGYVLGRYQGRRFNPSPQPVNPSAQQPANQPKGQHGASD